MRRGGRKGFEEKGKRGEDQCWSNFLKEQLRRLAGDHYRWSKWTCCNRRRKGNIHCSEKGRIRRGGKTRRAREKKEKRRGASYSGTGITRGKRAGIWGLE